MSLVVILIAGGVVLLTARTERQGGVGWQEDIVTTVFWVGEEASEENGYIANDVSAWDGSWQERFGGVDEPEDRCGHWPCDFEPKENPFYVALPYNDSAFKNKWVEVRYEGESCFGQWEDVGPFETDDREYVLGGAEPKNKQGVGAGLDVSPAMRDCLGLSGVGLTDWRLVDEWQVPEGPWREIVTTSPVRH